MTEPQDSSFIAYFAVHRTEDNEGYMGGMLVLDHRGVPQEFQCTLPIRPTASQKALYGNTLEPYLFSELIGAPLADSLSTGQDCYVVIVDTSMLLELREHVRLPVIHLEKHGDAFSADGDAAERRRLESTIPGYQSITARCHRDHEDDYELVRDKFEETFDRMNLLEPFERISIAFKVLMARDSRFR